MNLKTKLTGAAIAVLSAHVGLARADDRSSNRGDPSVAGGSAEETSVAPQGVAVQVGGGVTGFSRSASRDVLSTGGYWDVRTIVGTRSYLGAELAYVGSAREVNAPSIAGQPTMLGNGGEALARVGIPVELDGVRLTPFAFGGIGYSRLQLVDQRASASGVKEAANALTVPFGAGVGLAYRHFIMDARFTYRGVFDDDFVALAGSDVEYADLQNWSTGLTVGYEF
jgi:hypothetical protein